MEPLVPGSSALEDPSFKVARRPTDTGNPLHETSATPSMQDYVALGCLIVDNCSSTSQGLPRESPERSASGQLRQYDFPLRKEVLTLLRAKWIRVFSRPIPNQKKCVLRVFILPRDVGRSRFVLEGKARQLHIALEQLLHHIDVSTALWQGDGDLDQSHESHYDIAATAEESSLFYIFNTLPSPTPSPDLIKHRYTRKAVHELLDTTSDFRGLKSRLYPYQARSAAMMLQRETAPELVLDPRIELREAPNGDTFFYSPRDSSFLRHPRLYETVRGGILSETMGLGKTIICLAVILATKHHLPKIPAHYAKSPIVRARVGTLAEMAVATANQHSLPTKSYIDRMCWDRDETFATCLDHLSRHPPTYAIPIFPARYNRKTSIPPPVELTLCSGTLIVVPRNLVHQWQLELRKHICEGPTGLRTLVMNDSARALPSVSELRGYDIVLFSRQRFEREISDGQDRFGRRAADGASLACRCPYIGSTRKRDCTCLRDDEIYHSPLKQLHWLRIIIDEGHGFSSKTSNAVQVANKLVRAERRWIVSGTPARHRLFGVEVEVGSDNAIQDSRNPKQELSSPDATTGDVLFAPHTDLVDREQAQLDRQVTLKQRKRYSKDEEMRGGAQSLGHLATHFLKMRPFALNEFDAEKSDWDEHMFRHEARQRTYSSFSISLRRTLEALVVKTRPEDVERDIVLPPLHHRTVYLEPSFYDKLTINLFILVLTGNAVTSERTDQDYLFHEKSTKARNSLITNLRQSAFFWTGFTGTNVVDAIETGEKYLAKEDTDCTPEDRRTMLSCLTFARQVLQCAGWRALSRTHELGLFVDGWPSDLVDAWALAQAGQKSMIGVSHLLEAQSHVNSRLHEALSFDGLEALGIALMAQTLASEDEENSRVNVTNEAQSKAGLSMMTVHSDTSAAKRHYQASPSKPRPAKKKMTSGTHEPDELGDHRQPSALARKRKLSEADRVIIPESSPLKKPSILGTTSSKLSYLLDKILRYATEEKILIFYDGDNTAYYLAQCLELLHITHLIYAKSLPSERLAKYIVAFDENPRIRVLIMDIRCGAEGLNVNKASRVYFINPCCRPNIEAQAIKRSHRIGQTRPVHVETLVLRGTIEEAMFSRARSMTEIEHHQAKELGDDEKFADVIQNARSIPIAEDEFDGHRRMAPLAEPQQIFGRHGRAISRIQGIDSESHEDASATTRKKRRIKKTPNTGERGKERQKQEPLADDSLTTSGGQSAQSLAPGHFTSTVATPKAPSHSLFGG